MADSGKAEFSRSVLAAPLLREQVRDFRAIDGISRGFAEGGNALILLFRAPPGRRGRRNRRSQASEPTKPMI